MSFLADAAAGAAAAVSSGPPPAAPVATVKTTKKIDKISKKGERRLVEYFIVVSSLPREKGDDAEQKYGDSDNMSPFQPSSGRRFGSYDHDEEWEELTEGYDFQPGITARYPFEDHEGNPLHESVTSFCHPTGSIRLKPESCLPKVHYFVTTGGRGQHVYGTVLTIFEPFMITLKPSQKGDNDELEAGGEWKSGGEAATENATLKKMEVFLPKCLCILSQYPYLVAFREYLTQLHRLTKMGDMPLPVERYITNFCAEIPAPPPGSFEVQTTILDSVIKFWSPPHNQPIAWVSLPFSHLFECLDLDNVLLVWHCLSLERQVLFTSTQLSLLTTCSEVVLSLLFPMRWSHAYIPVLPHFLIPILSAPMPYLCGIDKANLPEALLDLSRECVVVDLDSNQVTLGPMTPALPPLPHSHAQSLRSRLEANAGMVFREARSLTKNDDFSERGTHLAPHVKMMADAMWESRLVLFDEAFHLAFTPEMEKRNLLNGNDNSGIDTSENDPYNPTVPIRIMTAAEKMNMRKQSQWDAVQEAFLDTYVYLLRNYRKFLIFPSKHNEGAYGGAGFREKEFVESQRYDMQAFLRELNGTQMFNDFVTKRLYGSGEADVLFFDMAVDNFLKNAGLMTNVSVGDTIKIRLTNGVGASPAVDAGPRKANSPRDAATNSAEAKKKGRAPLIQSARVHRKLKTIVPPEPSSADLPPPPPQPLGGPSTTLSGMLSAADPPTDADDQSVGSVSTTGTNSTGLASTARSGISSLTTPRSPRSAKGPSSYRRRQEQLAEALEKEEKHCYVYHSFPSELNSDLFGTPRPLNSAVLAEFAKQREDAARFRRNNSTEEEQAKAKKNGMDLADSKAAPQTAEMATFTVFFMAFTAAVGKELIEISRNPLTGGDRTIWSTYTHPVREMSDTDDETDVSSLAARAAGVDLSELEDEISLNVEDGPGGDEDDVEGKDGEDKREKEDGPEGTVINGDSHVEGSSNSVGNDDVDESESLTEKDDEGKRALTRENTPQVTNKSNATEAEETETPRKRFRENLSTAQIEEAKATARAQLGLAFEMLNMMRKRGLKADPVDYQSLIDACGRCGDAEKAAKLLTQMHEDGIAADGVVYACLVSAFSSDNSLRKVSGKSNEEDLPEWANSASVEVDWNKFQRRSYLEIAKERFLGRPESEEHQNSPNAAADDEFADTAGGRVTKLGIQSLRAMRNFVSGRRVRPAEDTSRTANAPELDSGVENRKDFFVTDTVLRQILLGENLLEIVYPDISVDTDNELCPRCNTLLTDEDVVTGWTPADSQDYTTKCPICPQKFVPHFCVQSTSESFVGSRGPGTPLLCERLSPWVLQKEVRSVMSDREGIEDLLSPEWREKETKNATLWWNLVLSFMRFKFPFSFLLQGSFDTTLIAPSPDDEVA